MDHVIRTAEQLKATIKAFRKAKKLSQKELAASMGITQQALSALEAQPQAASFERLMQLLSVLEVEITLRDKVPAKSQQQGEW